MELLDPKKILDEKDEEAQVAIARRTGDILCQDSLSEIDRRVSEEIARVLVSRAVERVRSELSKAIRYAKYLPRDLAITLAHDIESVACPFLEVTRVFGDAEWQSLILTVSKEARLSIAGRSEMTERVALALAETGEPEVVEVLLSNSSAPMDGPVGPVILERFSSTQRIMDKLGQRPDLLMNVAVKLVRLVSAAVRDELTKKYKLEDYTVPIVAEAEAAAILETVDGVPAEGLQRIAEQFQREGILKPLFLFTALRRKKYSFFVASLAALSGQEVSIVRNTLNVAELEVVNDLLKRTAIPSFLHLDVWTEIQQARKREPF